MRKFALRFGAISATLWIALKLVIFFAGKSIDLTDFTVMANNFFLLTSVSITIFIHKKSHNFIDVPKLEDIKAGIFGGMVYTVIIVLFSYYYNNTIDGSILENRIEQRVDQVSRAIASDKDFEEYKKINSEASKFSREQIIERERASTENFLNPKVSALILLMSFTLLTIFYAIFVTFVIRKIYLRGLK